MPRDPGERVEVRRLLELVQRQIPCRSQRPAGHGAHVQALYDGRTGRRPARHRRHPRGATNIRYHLAYIGWLVRARNWLAGDRLTYADLAAAAHLSVADYLGDVPWSEDEAAKSWYARVKSRPSFRPLLADTMAGISRRRRPTPISTSDRSGRDQGRADRDARAHGFSIVGITKPDAVPEAKERLERFLADGAHGDMAWLETTPSGAAIRTMRCGRRCAPSSCSG